MSFSYKELSIRPIERADLAWIQELRNSENTWMFLTDINMVSLDQEIAWFENLQQDKTRKYFTIIKNSTGSQIGIVRFTSIDWINRSICIGADISENYRGLGFGKQVTELQLEYCFKFLNMNRVWLLVADFNTKAHYIYTTIGFREEGKLRQALYREGEYRDYICMSVLFSEFKQIFLKQPTSTQTQDKEIQTKTEESLQEQTNSFVIYDQKIPLSSIAVLCVYHRRAPLFDWCIQHAYNLGLRHIGVIDTGNEKLGKFNAPCPQYFKDKENSYDGGFIYLHQHYQVPSDVEYLFLLDQDCFVFNPHYLEFLAGSCKQKNIDIASVSTRANMPLERVNSKETVLPFKIEDIGKPGLGGLSIPLENPIVCMSKQVFQECPKNVGVFSGEFWKALIHQNKQFGLHRCEYLTGSGQIDKGNWVHIGNLIEAYYKAERKQLTNISVNEGYFLTTFPGKYPTVEATRCEKSIQNWEAFVSPALPKNLSLSGIYNEVLKIQ